MSSRQLRANQGITRNVRQNISSDPRINQRVSSNVNRANTVSNNNSNSSSNNESVRTDEAIKINKILNLLNERLKTVESKTTNKESVETTVNFENNISLSKMNTLFSLMDARITSLENHNKLVDLNIDLENTSNNYNNTNNTNNTNDNKEEQQAINIDDINISELIDSNEKILDIENKLELLDKSVNNININGISNNFVKLSNLIQTIKQDCNKELTNFQAKLNKLNKELIQKSQIPKENPVKQEQATVSVDKSEHVLTVKERPVVLQEQSLVEESVDTKQLVVEEQVSMAEEESIVVNEEQQQNVEEESEVQEEQQNVEEESVVVNEDLFELKKTKSLDISMDVDNEKENIKISLEDENP